MDWNQQVEETMQTWIDTQQEVWDKFFGAMQGFGKSQSAQAWESTMSMGEDLWKNILKFQTEGLSAWVEGIAGVEGIPTQAVESARQFEEMTKRWNMTQIKLVENWFSVLKKFAPSTPGDAWADLPKNMFKTWQDTTQTIIDAQVKWMNAWMGKVGQTDDE